MRWVSIYGYPIITTLCVATPFARQSYALLWILYVCHTARAISLALYKRNKKLHPRALSSYISTWEFLRTLLKIPACLYNSTMHSDEVFYFFYIMLKKSLLIFKSASLLALVRFWAPSWCRRHRIRHNGTSPHKPIVLFVCFPRSFVLLFFIVLHQLRLLYQVGARI